MVLPTSLTTTHAPRRASSSAYRRPRPRPAPVTIATCPSKPTMLCFLALVANRQYRFRERGTTVRFSVVRSLEQLEPELDRLRLLASAFAGRTVEVAATDPGECAWTDGSTLFVDAGASHADQVRMLGVQASLLAAGSLAPDVVRQLSWRPALARRYLAVEAHRALAANDDLLPAVVRRLLDREVAAGLVTADASLARARSPDTIDDAPMVFGAIHARRLLTSVDRPEAAAARADSALAMPASKELAELIELADAEDDGADLGHLLSSPVGGGGAVGRLLRRLLSPARKRGGGGPAGAWKTASGDPREPRHRIYVSGPLHPPVPRVRARVEGRRAGPSLGAGRRRGAQLGAALAPSVRRDPQLAAQACGGAARRGARRRLEGGRPPPPSDRSPLALPQATGLAAVRGARRPRRRGGRADPGGPHPPGGGQRAARVRGRARRAPRGHRLGGAGPRAAAAEPARRGPGTSTRRAPTRSWSRPTPGARTIGA